MIRTEEIVIDLVAGAIGTYLGNLIAMPATIKRIVLPAQPAGTGWIEATFGQTTKALDKEVKQEDIQDLTWLLAGGDKIYLPTNEAELKPKCRVQAHNWRLAITAYNGMKTTQQVKIQVEYELWEQVGQ